MRVARFANGFTCTRNGSNNGEYTFHSSIRSERQPGLDCFKNCRESSRRHAISASQHRDLLAGERKTGEEKSFWKRKPCALRENDRFLQRWKAAITSSFTFSGLSSEYLSHLQHYYITQLWELKSPKIEIIFLSFYFLCRC